LKDEIGLIFLFNLKVSSQAFNPVYVLTVYFPQRDKCENLNLQNSKLTSLEISLSNKEEKERESV
jgi:hypothetical protein